MSSGKWKFILRKNTDASEHAFAWLKKDLRASLR